MIGDGSRARPLHCAVLVRHGKRWNLRLRDRKRALLKLPSLDPDSIEALLAETGARGRVAILADCVFGVAASVLARQVGKPSTEVWRTMRMTLSQTGSARFGRGPAEKFFEMLLGSWEGAGRFPRRRCEQISGANSIFQTRPFQKNIQTGTYRIWKDIAGGKGLKPWLNLWPFDSWDPQDARPWIFEGFPSYFWKDLFGLRTRDRAKLRASAGGALGKRVIVEDWRTIESNADVADAAVLALSGLMLQDERRLFAPFPDFECSGDLRREGWIAGLREP